MVWRGSMITRRYSFFFSSRRRHTRFDCDWSSDVCSSDLLYPPEPGALRARRDSGARHHDEPEPAGGEGPAAGAAGLRDQPDGGVRDPGPARQARLATLQAVARTVAHPAAAARAAGAPAQGAVTPRGSDGGAR